MSAVYTGRRQKYAAKRCTEHTPAHASLKECRRYTELCLLEKAGEIRNLLQQVPFQLAPPVVIDGRKKPALRFVADFVYEEWMGREENHLDGTFRDVWVQIIEDSKGVQTPVFRLKRHLMAAKGVEVRLT